MDCVCNQTGLMQEQHGAASSDMAQVRLSLDLVRHGFGMLSLWQSVTIAFR